MTESIKPPDIKTTRLRIVIGATIIGDHDKILTLDPDCKVAPLRFTEDTDQISEKPLAEPRLFVEFQHGTVDEMVADFRNKLTAAFHDYTYSNPDGTGPCVGKTQEQAEERWLEIELLQEILANSDCSWPNTGGADVMFIPFTPPSRMKEKKARQTQAEAKEREQLLAQADLADAG